MTDREFDEKVRKLCSGMSEMPNPGVWEDIQARMSAGRRLVFRRRAGIAAAVAAAAAAVVLFMTWPSDNRDSVDVSFPETPSVQLADAVVTEAVQPDELEITSRTESPAVPDVCPRPATPRNTGTARNAPSVPEPVTYGQSTADTSETVSPDAAGHIEGEQSAPEMTVVPGSVSGEYSVSDYLAFQENDIPKDRRVSISASTDFYTVYGSGNVNFSAKSMSAGGVSAAGMPAVKPLNGETPHHDLPLTAGVDVQYGFGPENSCGQHRFGVGLGVNYTFMRSQYQALVSKDYLHKYGEGREQVDVKQYINYVGIPVYFKFNIITTDKLFFYASIGGEIEKGVQLKYRFTDSKGITSLQTLSISGLQWSANVGLGFEYRFLNFMGVYVDPRLTYFFDCSQPYSIREEQRLQLNLNVGLRFHF